MVAAMDELNGMVSGSENRNSDRRPVGPAFRGDSPFLFTIHYFLLTRSSKPVGWNAFARTSSRLG